MKFREPVEFQDILKTEKENPYKDISYCVYSKLSDSDNLRLDTICYIDDYPEVTENDEEMFSEFVENNSLSLLFRDELIHDVISNIFYQKPSATDLEILKAICYYSKNDCFMKLNP